MFGGNKEIQEKFVCCLLALEDVSRLMISEKKDFTIKKAGYKFGGSASFVLSDIKDALTEVGREVGLIKKE